MYGLKFGCTANVVVKIQFVVFTKMRMDWLKVDKFLISIYDKDINWILIYSLLLRQLLNVRLSVEINFPNVYEYLNLLEFPFPSIYMKLDYIEKINTDKHIDSKRW